MRAFMHAMDTARAFEVILENANDGTVKVVAFDPETGIELEQSFGVNSEDRNSVLLQQKNLVNNIYINNL